MTTTTGTMEFELVSDAEVAAAIRVATNDVFSTMLGVELTSVERLAPELMAPRSGSGIISVIGIVGEWCGSGSVSCSADFGCFLSSKFLMSEFPAVNEDVLDSIGEITNMIIGNVKTLLEEKVGPLGLSTPTVIFGRNFETRSARNHKWTGLRFVSGENQIVVQVCFAPNPTLALGKTVQHGFRFPSVLSI